MTTIDLTSQLLTWLVTYGSPVVALVLIGTTMGAPVPSTLLVIAVGARTDSNGCPVGRNAIPPG